MFNINLIFKIIKNWYILYILIDFFIKKFVFLLLVFLCVYIVYVVFSGDGLGKV